MKTPLDKKTYIKLAKAYCEHYEYENRVRDFIKDIAEEYFLDKDVIELPVIANLITNVVLELLGIEFEYFFYKYDRSFDKYNSNVTLEDGSHPNVKDFGDLWELENKLHEEAQ